MGMCPPVSHQVMMGGGDMLPPGADLGGGALPARPPFRAIINDKGGGGERDFSQ